MKMASYAWVWASIGTLVCFGGWGFFGKLTSLYLSPKQAFVFQGLGVFAASLCCYGLMQGNALGGGFKGITLALFTGLAYAAGTLLFFYASAHGKISLVIMLTALYPVITILLSFIFLHESITVTQFIGMMLAVLAIVLMSIEY